MRTDALPADCTGKTVLDIGGYDGEIAAECLRRGASSAIVFDNGQWTDYTWAKPLVKPGCVYQRGDLMDWGAVAPKPADIVLLYNVIYHIRDPWAAIERCRVLTKETFVICTSFIEGDKEDWRLQGRNDLDIKINDVHTIFWRPTIPGLRRMLELNGFTIDEQVGPVGDHVCIRCH
jgi:tRNA (mo5U34)-methyltransferase